MAREDGALVDLGFRYCTLTAAQKSIPLKPRMLGQACLLASPHKFCAVWLVSGTLTWVVNRHPDPGQAC